MAQIKVTINRVFRHSNQINEIDYSENLCYYLNVYDDNSSLKRRTAFLRCKLVDGGEKLMEQHIKHLLKRLDRLGYCSFEIKSIIQDAIGRYSIDIHNLNHAQGVKVISHLEKYEQLGSKYIQVYSK